MVDRRELSLGIMFTGHMDTLLRNTLGTLRTDMAALAGATTKTGTAAAGTAPKIKRVGDEFSHVGKQLSRVSGGLQRLTAAFKVVAAYGIAGTLTFGIIQSLRRGVGAIFEFDQALYNLKAIANASEVDLQAMGKAIFDVAESTKFSAAEVGDAMVLLAQAGFTAEESVEAIDSVAKLATGTLSDLKTSSDLLTTVIRAFGLEAREAGRVADVMANAVNRSKLTVDKLRIAFNYIGPVANKVGLSIEETAAATMVLANAGIRASTIGTGLRQVLARLKAPSEKLREAFIAAGADLGKFTGDAFNMREAMKELVKIVPNATRAFELFGLRGAPAVAALTEAGVEGFDDMYDAVLRAGEATRMAETQMQGLVVMAKNLADRLGTLAIRIGEGGVAGAFEVFIRVAREAVKVASDFADSLTGKIITGTLVLTGVITALTLSLRYLGYIFASIAFAIPIKAVGAMVIEIGLLKTAGWSLVAMFSRLWILLAAHPIFTITAAVSALIAAFSILRRHRRQELLDMEAQEKAATKNVESLEAYKEELSKLISGSKEYGAVLRRLGADFEELSKYIDKGTNSWRDHGVALDELSKKEAEKAIYRLVYQLKEYVNELELLEKSTFDVELPELVGMEAPEGLADTSKILAELETRFDRLPDLFHRLGFTAETSVKNIRGALRGLFEDTKLEPYIEKMVSVVLTGLLRISREIDDFVPTAKDLLAEVPEYWMELFKTMDAEGQSYFVQSLARADKEVAAYDKRSKDLKLSEEQLAAARTAIRLKEMEASVEKIYGEILGERERRDILIRMEEDFRKHKKDLLDEELANIKVFGQEDFLIAQKAAGSKEELDAKWAKAKEKRDAQVVSAHRKYSGEMDAIDGARRRRGLADTKEYEEEIVRIRQRYTRLMATLEIDPVAKLKAEYEARIGIIRANLAAELKLATGNKDRIVAAEVEAHNAMMKAWKRFIFDKSKLEIDKTEETLRLEAAQLEHRLEAMRSAAADQYDTSKEFKLKELELEEELLAKYNALAAKRYELSKELLGEDHKETIKRRKELFNTLTDIEKAYGDRRRTQFEIDQKALLRSSQDYLNNRIAQMRAAGETETEIERERWEHMAEYSESWLKKLRAGLGLATLDFREAATDWAGLVQDVVGQMSASMGEWFYRLAKGSEDASEVWKDMLDGMLRYLMQFLARKAVMDFLMLLGGAVGGGGTTTAGTKPTPAAGTGTRIIHRGGEVGVDIMPKRFAPDWLFNLAPRLHQGLRQDEFPAILQRGEEVTPRGETGGGGVRQINIFTPDTRTMAEWVRRNRAVFAGATVDSIKEGNRALIGAIRSSSRG